MTPEQFIAIWADNKLTERGGVAEKLSTLTTETYLAARAARGSSSRFRDALAKVPAVEPETFNTI